LNVQSNTVILKTYILSVSHSFKLIEMSITLLFLFLLGSNQLLYFVSLLQHYMCRPFILFV